MRTFGLAGTAPLIAAVGVAPLVLVAGSAGREEEASAGEVESSVVSYSRVEICELIFFSG